MFHVVRAAEACREHLVGSHAGDPSVEFWTLRNWLWLRRNLHTDSQVARSVVPTKGSAR